MRKAAASGKVGESTAGANRLEGGLNREALRKSLCLVTLLEWRPTRKASREEGGGLKECYPWHEAEELR